MLKRIFRRKRRGEHGMQLIEMAFVMPVLMLVMGGLVELSYYFYTYSTLARATRAGAGYISSKSMVSTETDKAKNLVVCGELNSCSGFSPLVPGLTAANVSVTVATVGTDKQVTVKIINYSYTPLFKLNEMSSLFTSDTSKQIAWNTSVTQVNAGTTMRYVGDR
ncbi:MAG: pilus assembly protein [Acidobacteria bacterium]|nr:pilus assembly protein [Acidobacteriota bacterium]MBI3423685.1 pilus assembly protein [Acidobacteriota bacterium]